MRAAVELGQIAARGWLSTAECAAALIAAAAAIANQATPGRDPAGLRMRLAHAWADSCAAEHRARRRAAWRIDAALRPALVARARQQILVQIAEEANHGVFTSAELSVQIEQNLALAMHWSYLEN